MKIVPSKVCSLCLVVVSCCLFLFRRLHLNWIVFHLCPAQRSSSHSSRNQVKENGTTRTSHKGHVFLYSPLCGMLHSFGPSLSSPGLLDSSSCAARLNLHARFFLPCFIYPCQSASLTWPLPSSTPSARIYSSSRWRVGEHGSVTAHQATQNY